MDWNRWPELRLSIDCKILMFLHLSMSDIREQMAYSESGLPDETRREGREGEGEGEQQDGSRRRWGGSALRSRRSSEDPCRLHSILLQVRDVTYISDLASLSSVSHGTMMTQSEKYHRSVVLTSHLKTRKAEGGQIYYQIFLHKSCCKSFI